MCFSPLVSWATAALGISVGIVAKVKHKPATLYIPPGYFGFMEILQGLMYTQLHNPIPYLTSILIYIAYIHVCFQPLVFNYWLGSFIGPKQREIYRFTLKLCFVGGLLLLARLMTSGVSFLCPSYEALCNSTGPNIFYGLYHIAWDLPLKASGYVTPSLALHFFLFFIPGLLLGFYRLIALFFILGPVLAYYITPIPSEQSSIWCVIGLWILVITVIATFNKPPRFLIPER